MRAFKSNSQVNILSVNELKDHSKNYKSALNTFLYVIMRFK